MKGIGIVLLSFAVGIGIWAAMFAVLMWMVPTCPRSLAAFLMFFPAIFGTVAIAEECK